MDILFTYVFMTIQEIQKQFNELQVEFQKLIGKLEILEEQEKDSLGGIIQGCIYNLPYGIG